jgi:redox-sensitive bicupin YhaK (pirin superfamily)
MSAGTGILHSERNDSWRSSDVPDPDPGPAERPVHFVQMWVTPDEHGIVPGYEQFEVAERLASGGLVPVASGLPRHQRDTAIRIHQRDAGLSIARLADRATVLLPSAPYLHVFIAHGSVDVEGAGALAAGDAARISDADGQRVTAIGPAEVLVWEMHAAML